jgi:hypothetical protein
LNDTFITQFKPLLKNSDPPTLAEISDVIVTVNSVVVNITEMDATTGSITIDVVPAFGDTVVVEYYYNSHFVYRIITFYLNNYVISGNDFDPAQESIFNTFNVADVWGDFSIDPRRHAHVCETDLTFGLNILEGDTYEFPECNNSRFFYLNNYSVTPLNEFDSQQGSYLNDLNIIGRNNICGYLFFDWNFGTIEEDPIEEPQDHLQSVGITGSENIEDALVISENANYAFRFSEISDVLNWEPFILNESLLNWDNGLAECPDQLISYSLKMEETYLGISEELTDLTL